MLRNSILNGNEYPSALPYCFPASIEVQGGVMEAPYSRLGWCYGDLSMANVLLHCGKVLQNDQLMNKGIETALKTTRRTFENTGCLDAPFCHGSVGLVHQYNRLYQLTNLPQFWDAREKWINITLQYFYNPAEYAGGYYTRSFNKEKNSFELSAQCGLLEGMQVLHWFTCRACMISSPTGISFFLPIFKIKIENGRV